MASASVLPFPSFAPSRTSVGNTSRTMRLLNAHLHAELCRLEASIQRGDRKKSEAPAAAAAGGGRSLSPVRGKRSG